MTPRDKEARKILSEVGLALSLGAEDPEQHVPTLIERTLEVLKLTLADWKAKGRRTTEAE